MNTNVAPLKVSPLIKTLRWTFLLCGIFYGVNRLHYLRAYEEIEGPKRRARIKEKNDKLDAEMRERTINEIIGLGEAFEVVDFPPEWEKSVFKIG